MQKRGGGGAGGAQGLRDAKSTAFSWSLGFKPLSWGDVGR